DSWCAMPLVTSAIQTNGYDCGVWVLAIIAANFRGFHTTTIMEREIRDFQSMLGKLAHTLPLK
ncbi:hypothetical protein L218DRAFT_877097, partial [Marasmius fiardii PR-910]